MMHEKSATFNRFCYISFYRFFFCLLLRPIFQSSSLLQKRKLSFSHMLSICHANVVLLPPLHSRTFNASVSFGAQISGSLLNQPIFISNIINLYKFKLIFVILLCISFFLSFRALTHTMESR